MSQGKTNEIVICMGSSCFSRGNKVSLGIIREYLRERNIEAEVTFRGAHCLGVCEQGPVLILDAKTHKKVMPEDISGILDDFFSGS